MQIFGYVGSFFTMWHTRMPFYLSYMDENISIEQQKKSVTLR